jgi:hypothetical protein
VFTSSELVKTVHDDRIILGTCSMETKASYLVSSVFKPAASTELRKAVNITLHMRNKAFEYKYVQYEIHQLLKLLEGAQAV